MNQTSRNRLIKGDGYVLVMEEVPTVVELYDMFLQISSFIRGSQNIIHDLQNLNNGLDNHSFVALHYYAGFVSPSNFQGYALVMLPMVPEGSSEGMREHIQQFSDMTLGRIMLIAARDDDSQDKFNILKQESARLVETRAKYLRNL